MGFLFKRTAVGGYTAETLLWISRANALGGAPTTSDKNLVDALSVQLAAKSYTSKLIWLAPWVGPDIATHRIPLRDTIGVGAMTLLGTSPFTNADVSTATGISNLTSKDAYLSTLLAPNQLDATLNGFGLGFWERNYLGSGTYVEPIGCYNAANTERMVIDLRTTVQAFRAGAPSSGVASVASSAISANYYGQRSSATKRELYRNGVLLDDDTTFVSISDLNQIIFVMGCNQSPDVRWGGRSAVAYLTDGKLTAAEVLDLHNTLDTYLVTPTGR